MTLIVRRPPPPLAQVVRAITYQAGEQPQTSRERLVPGVGTSLWVNLNQDEFRSFAGSRWRSVPGAMLAGPGDRAMIHEFEAGRAHLSVEFALGGAASLFTAPLSVARNEMVPLPYVWGRDGADLRERLLDAPTPEHKLRVLEQALLAHVVEPPCPDPAVLCTARALEAGTPVATVAADLGMLPRTLRRLFLTQVGLTPKRFARVQRLRRVVGSITSASEVNWAALAADHGYYDQAHLIGEFREIAGVTPTEYLRDRVDGPHHLRAPGV
jgi:AraC-like DNA-binding protein